MSVIESPKFTVDEEVAGVEDVTEGEDFSDFYDLMREEMDRQQQVAQELAHQGYARRMQTRRDFSSALVDPR